MSVGRSGTLPPRNQPEMPGYFRKDRVGRDEFLSQLGHFGEDHRRLFSRLCDMWEPDMPYAKFFTKAGHDYLNADAALNALMLQLERGKCGVISRTVKDGRLEKDRIILTDRDSPRFWYWMVENAWQACRIADRRPFPTVPDIRKHGDFPNDILQPLSLAEISDTFIRDHQDEVLLYALPDLDGTTLIVTPATLHPMTETARQKIRGILADSPLQPGLSRLMGTVVSHLRQSLSKNDTTFWNKLTDAIIVHKEDLLAKKSNLSGELFIAAKILKVYTRNELDEAKRRQEQDAEKREVMKGLLLQLARTNDFLVSPDEFKTQFDPYKDQWPDLREMFVSRYMTNTDRTGLPVVVNVGDDYLHRDHLYPLFKARHSAAASELRQFYSDMIERILRTNNKDKITAFAGIDAFRDDIRSRLITDFPIFNRLLTTPRMVSEGIIHYASKVLKIADMEKVKGLLQRYFEAGSIRFKEPDRLFNLSPRIMFNEAFGRLGWFRRLILKLFGRYESYIQAFNSALLPRDKRKLRSISERTDTTEPSGPARPYRPSRKPGEGAAPGAVRRRKQTGVMPRSYTAKQQNEAWDEFRNAYKRKKDKR